MASTLLSHSGLILKGSAKLHPWPAMAAPRLRVVQQMKKGGIKCKVEAEKLDGKSSGESTVSATATVMAVAAAAVAAAGPAAALVDERMSTEGTGLPFGLSNNLLAWIIAGVFALIWALYFVYASSLDEDEDSGLSL